MSLNHKAVFINVADFGAKADGITKDTQAVQKAVELCRKNGGGTVYFPAGQYLTGPIHFCSNMTLYIESGALIKFSTDFNDFMPVKTRWEGVECYGFSPLIYGNDLENITITGRGILDGQGHAWWNELKRKRKQNSIKPESDMEIKLAELNPGFEKAGSGGGGRETQFLRPPLIQFINCKNVLIEGITAQNSPFWNTHPVYCDNLTITKVTFKNPSDAPNTDGLDIDSCRNVRISDCLFDVGDDCLCLKSGIGEDGIKVGRPIENVSVTNCTMLNGHGGVVFGSETAGGIKNVAVSNCVFIGTDRGIRFKSRRGRAGIIEDISFNNIIMKDVLCPIVMNLYYRCGSKPEDDILFSTDKQPVISTTPALRNVNINNVSARGIRGIAAFIVGLPEMPIENLRIYNFNAELYGDYKAAKEESAMSRGIDPMEGRGVWAKFIKNARFNEFFIRSQNKDSFAVSDSSDVVINGNTVC